ncbi:MAG: ABC transporter substrate-binding protein [Lachnospirales bacterium]
MKRKICLGLTMLFLFGGCGTKNEEENTVGNMEGSSGVVDDKDGVGNADVTDGTLVIWEHSTSFDEPVEKVIEGFSEKNPDVNIEYETNDNEYYSLLATAIQAGDGPDVFWTNGTSTPVMGDYVNNGLIYDLTNDVDFTLFNEITMKISEINGSYYSVPWLNMDTRAVFYNKDMFKENGWSIPKTFSEFEGLLGTINETEYIPISLSGMDPWALLFAFEPILAGNEPEYTLGLDDYSVGAADQAVEDTIKLMKTWGDKGYFGKNWIGVNDSGQTLGFTSGKAAMIISGSWSITGIAENNPALNFGAFVIPSEDGRAGLVGTPANGFSVNANSENLPAAIEFAKYCATLDGQTRFVQTMGGVSASDKIESLNEVANEITKSGQGNLFTSWQSVLAQHSNEGIAAAVYEQDFPKIFSGDISVGDFLSEINEVME